MKPTVTYDLLEILTVNSKKVIHSIAILSENGSGSFVPTENIILGKLVTNTLFRFVFKSKILSYNCRVCELHSKTVLHHSPKQVK